MILTQLDPLETWAKESLLGVDSQSLVQLTQERLKKLLALQSSTPHPTVLLAESDPARFLAGFVAARAADCAVFLGNPNWAAAEWQQVFSLMHPDLIFGKVPLPISPISPSPHLPNWIMIPTGGSSGKIRFAIHTWETLTAAVRGFQEFFAVEQINSCCVLPLYHVSGLMQFLRSFTTGGKLIVVPFKTLESLTSPFNFAEQFAPANSFLSLVPTQLQRLLQRPAAVDWLTQFRIIFLGGAPAWDDLLAAARAHHLPLAPTYGMTETAAQIATLPPELFLNGKRGSGQVLPHAEIQICGAASAPSPQVGTIVIQAKSLMLGYFPDATYPDSFPTDDLGYFDAQGILHIVGRNSQKIITGGENVFPSEVEAALRATGLVNDVCVVGIPDQTWGEAVTAIYVPESAAVSISALKAALTPQLSSFKHPKQWIAVQSLPRNAQGKINRESLKQFL